MDNNSNAVTMRARRLITTLLRILQWCVFAFGALLVTAILSDHEKLKLPDAPIGWYVAFVATGLITLALTVPPVFFRLPRLGKGLAYVGVVASLVTFGLYDERMRPVWERTPEGSKEAAARAQEEIEQGKRDETSRLLANLDSAKKQAEAIQAKQEACFTTFGHRLPALEKPVKASLHNPDAFEHVETILIVPDENRNNVEMKFRAENGFGAIRTATIRAQLIADDCSVQNIGQPNTD